MHLQQAQGRRILLRAHFVKFPPRAVDNACRRNSAICATDTKITGNFASSASNEEAHETWCKAEVRDEAIQHICVLVCDRHTVTDVKRRGIFRIDRFTRFYEPETSYRVFQRVTP